MTKTEEMEACRYCGGAKRFQIVSPVSDHAWADCFCSRRPTVPEGLVEAWVKLATELRHAIRVAGVKRTPGLYEQVMRFDARYAELLATLSPASHDSRLAGDVRRLVIAARIVVSEDQGPEALRELDQASEAFASRVPWENENE